MPTMVTRRIVGRPAAAGLAFGPPLVMTTGEVPDDAEVAFTVEAAAIRTAERFEVLAERARAAGREDEAEMLETYAMMAEDPSLLDAIARHEAGGFAPVAAVHRAVDEVAAVFAAMDNEYLAQRADDVAGVGRELIATLTDTVSSATEVADGAIVCAEDLTPADTVQIELERIGGLATARGGPTSHTAIVARAAGIPAVVGATGLIEEVHGAEVLLLDGDRGEVVIDPDPDTVQEARARMEAAERQAAEHRRLRGQHVTFGGQRILVAANVGGPQDLDAAVEAEADGIGLFRSEFLFLDRDDAPSYQEQLEAYAAAVRAFEDPTVVRTLDIGGDKDVPYLELPREDNPFLGVRGLRLCLERPALFNVQLDALVTAAKDGRLRVMFPMVASVADLDAGLRRLSERAEVAGLPPAAPGIMIETPAAALLASHLAPRCAFFSVGTNDLTQYTAAADRGLAELSAYQDPAQPAVLQLIDLTCTAAREAGIPVAVCGEAASDPAAAALLLGLGVHELSVAPSLVDRTRWLVTQLDPDAARRAARAALRAPDPEAVREIAVEILP